MEAAKVEAKVEAKVQGTREKLMVGKWPKAVTVIMAYISVILDLMDFRTMVRQKNQPLSRHHLRVPPAIIVRVRVMSTTKAVVSTRDLAPTRVLMDGGVWTPA